MKQGIPQLERPLALVTQFLLGLSIYPLHTCGHAFLNKCLSEYEVRPRKDCGCTLLRGLPWARGRDMGTEQDIPGSVPPGNPKRNLGFRGFLPQLLEEQGTPYSDWQEDFFMLLYLFSTHRPPETLGVSQLALTGDSRQGGVACVTCSPRDIPPSMFFSSRGHFGKAGAMPPAHTPPNPSPDGA